MKYIFLLFSLTLVSVSCGPKIVTNITNQRQALTTSDKVAFLDVGHAVPSDAKLIGSAKFGESGFSTDCSFNSNLIKAREIARKNGANIVKVVEVKKPDLWSTCHRMQIEFYTYDGNVSLINQYQLQIP